MQLWQPCLNFSANNPENFRKNTNTKKIILKTSKNIFPKNILRTRRNNLWELGLKLSTKSLKKFTKIQKSIWKFWISMEKILAQIVLWTFKN